MTVFEIIKEVGIGVQENPIVEHSTGLLYNNEEDAYKKAKRLWLRDTTENERNSEWCALNYHFVERIVK